MACGAARNGERLLCAAGDACSAHAKCIVACRVPGPDGATVLLQTSIATFGEAAGGRQKTNSGLHWQARLTPLASALSGRASTLQLSVHMPDAGPSLSARRRARAVTVALVC